MLSVTISASWPRWMPWRSSPESRRGRAICGRSSLWQHGEQTRTAAPARTPRSIAWSVAVSQACRAIITSTAAGAKRAQVALRRSARPAHAAALGDAVAERDELGAQLDAGHLAARRRSAGAGARGRRTSGSPCRRRSRRRASARRRRRASRPAAHRARGRGPRGTCRSGATCAPSPAPAGGSRR